MSGHDPRLVGVGAVARMGTLQRAGTVTMRRCT